MGFEIPLDSDYFEHPKVIRLVAKLGKRADVFPLRLFAWAAKFAKKGKTDGKEQIELACRWDGKPGLLHAALVECGIIDRDGKTIHDWMDYAGRKLASYERKKAAQRAAYKAAEKQHSAGILPEENGILPPDTPEDCHHASRPSANLVNETKRNETKPDETTQNDTAFSSEDFSIPALAQSAAFDEGWSGSADRIAKWHTVLSDLENSGFSRESIAVELKRKPLKSEAPWDFLKRLMGKKHANSTLNDGFTRPAGDGRAK